jgi:flagellin
MSSTMERLSTGIRINSAKDDAAGLAISSKMTSQINGLNQAVRNANDAISMIQVAEGAMGGMTDMLQRMRELAIQAISDSNTAADRTALDSEFDELKAAINDLAEDTEWNGTALLTGSAGSSGTVTFQIGANASQTIAVKFADFTTNETLNTSNVVADEPLKSLQTDSDSALDAVLGNSSTTGLNISTSSDAALALVGLADAINNVDSQRATLGASMSRLEYASDNLTNVAQNTSAARSRILDADYAAETTELARTQIIQQAATAMLAQANQSQQQVLALLR